MSGDPHRVYVPCNIMGTRAATVLSITGVLAAGAIAAIVNTRAMAGADEQADLPVVFAEASAPTTTSTIPPGTVVVSSAVVSISTTTSVAVTGAPTSSLPQSTRSAFAIGQSGTVTLDRTNDVLTIVDVVPSPGWVVTSTRIMSPTEVEVTFSTAAVDVVATAVLRDQAIVATAMARAPTPTSNPATSSPAAPSGPVPAPPSVATQVAPPPAAPAGTSPAAPTATTSAPTHTTLDDVEPTESDGHGTEVDDHGSTPDD